MPTIAAACAAHVLSHGPCHPEEVHRALVARGVTAARTDASVRTALRASRLVVELADGRYDARVRVLQGSVLTVRARSRLADDVLWVHDDLAPLHPLLSTGSVPLRSGGRVSLGTGPVRTLRGPVGWLPRSEPGQLVGVRWDGQVLDVGLVEDALAADDPAVAQARLVIDRHRRAHAQDGRAPDLGEVVLSALSEAPDLLVRPMPPLSEVLERSAFAGTALPRWALPEGDWALQDASPVALPLPARVIGEIERRAGLLGEDPAEHASVLLSAAVDRVGRVDRSVGSSWESTYEEYDRYDDRSYGTVVRPERWRMT